MYIKMGRKIFVTGIGTDVGKTIVSAILTEAWEADYWKPMQAGNLDMPESHIVRDLISNERSVIHSTHVNLQIPASPHYAAEKEGRIIVPSEISVPTTENHLIIEGAGGLMVPINRKETVLDWIRSSGFEVILVSRHYLGSINHTLLSIQALSFYQIPLLGIIFNGDDTFESASVISEMTNIRVLGHVPQLSVIDKEQIKRRGKSILSMSDL
jgi:dethiobiotin synthetase